MDNSSNQKSKFEVALDTIYEKCLSGLPTSESIYTLSEDYLNKSNSVNEAIDKLIKNQCLKTGATGFVTGLGGVMTLPVSIPADLASSVYVEMRMASCIAYMRGYDVLSDQVKTMVYLTLCGDSATKVLKDIGIEVSMKSAKVFASKISGKLLQEINKKVGFRLFTKAGTKGVINIGKAIPLIGGFVGGGFNIISTKAIGEVAKKYFD